MSLPVDFGFSRPTQHLYHSALFFLKFGNTVSWYLVQTGEMQIANKQANKQTLTHTTYIYSEVCILLHTQIKLIYLFYFVFIGRRSSSAGLFNSSTIHFYHNL